MSRVMVSCSIGQGESSDFNGYLEQHQLSIACANLTLDHLGEEIGIWHRHIDDLRAALGGRDALEIDQAIPGHQRFALHLEAGALSTAKAALDCCLGGLYVQGSLLTRHLFETWQAIAYTFLDPQGAQGWLSPTGTVTTPPDPATVRRALLDSSEYRSWAVQVEKAIGVLDRQVHPVHGTASGGAIALGGVFDAIRAREAIRFAVIAQMLILQEHRHHLPHERAWIKRHFATLMAMKERFPELRITVEGRERE